MPTVAGAAATAKAFYRARTIELYFCSIYYCVLELDHSNLQRLFNKNRNELLHPLDDPVDKPTNYFLSCLTTTSSTASTSPPVSCSRFGFGIALMCAAAPAAAAARISYIRLLISCFDCE